jgi:hypothetical protein
MHRLAERLASSLAWGLEAIEEEAEQRYNINPLLKGQSHEILATFVN